MGLHFCLQSGVLFEMWWQSGWTYFWVMLMLVALGLLGFLTDDGRISSGSSTSCSSAESCQFCNCSCSSDMFKQISQLQHTIQEMSSHSNDLLQQISQLHQTVHQMSKSPSPPNQIRGKLEITKSWVLFRKQLNICTSVCICKKQFYSVRLV